jgi:hypothetical protein
MKKPQTNRAKKREKKQSAKRRKRFEEGMREWGERFSGVRRKESDV